MFFKLFSMLGWIDQGHRRAAVTARELFSSAYPGYPVAWTEITADEPAQFVVAVYYGHDRPKKRRLYAVDKQTFKAVETADPERS